jgi:hypothetical protein
MAAALAARRAVVRAATAAGMAAGQETVGADRGVAEAARMGVGAADRISSRVSSEKMEDKKVKATRGPPFLFDEYVYCATH